MIPQYIFVKCHRWGFRLRREGIDFFKLRFLNKRITNFVCLIECFKPHEHFFSYLAVVTISGDRAANLDLCLAFTAFSSEGFLTCHTYCDTGTSYLRSYPKDPWFSLLNVMLLAKEQSLPILTSKRLDVAGVVKRNDSRRIMTGGHFST
jgi:hypothetical protein